MKALSFIPYAVALILGCDSVQRPEHRPEPSAVKASSFGWNAEDATKCLQTALDSGARKIVIDRQTGDWIVETLIVRSTNLEIVVAADVAVRAKKDSFKGLNDCLFKFCGCRNVTLRGEKGAVLAMRKADYVDPKKYAFSEWRHAVSVLGGENVTVRDLVLESSGGDGVYVRDAAKRVLLENLVCQDHNRQGLSVISAVGLTVRNCAFNETWGAAPQCGVDLEPNTPADRLEDILFEDCAFDGNRSSGLLIYLGPLSAETRPVSVTFRRCTMRGNANCGIAVYAASEGSRGVCRGKIVFEDCAVSGNRENALVVKGTVKGGVETVFRGCTFDARGGKDAGVLFGGDRLEAFTGVDAGDSRLILGPDQADVVYGGVPGTGAENLKGAFAVECGGGKRTVDLSAWAKRQLQDPDLRDAKSAPLSVWELAPVLGRFGRPGPTGNLRKRFVFFQHVPAAGTYPIAFKLKPLGKRKGGFGASFRLRDRPGTDLGVVRIPDEGFTYNLESKGENVYRFEVDSGSGLMEVVSPLPGAAVQADAKLSLFGGRGRTWSFYVPAGGEKVRVRVFPDEACDAELVAPDGCVVDSKPYTRVGKVLVGARAADDPGGVWKIRFPRIEEDAAFIILAPAVPVASPK